MSPGEGPIKSLQIIIIVIILIYKYKYKFTVTRSSRYKVQYKITELILLIFELYNKTIAILLII